MISFDIELGDVGMTWGREEECTLSGDLLQRHSLIHVYCGCNLYSQKLKTIYMPVKDKWILNMWYLYIIKDYSAVKNLNHEIFR